MYAIALCDDDNRYMEMIHHYILEFANLMNIGVDIYKFESGHEFLKAARNGSSPFDIIFLDIDMPGINGLETAEDLRASGIDSILVFVTSMEDKVYEAFGYNALRFVLKRNLKDGLKNAFMKAIDTLDESGQRFHFKTSDGLVRLTVNEILYFIYEERKVKAVCRNESVHALNSVTLSQIEELTSKKGFVVINRYAIVNIKFVDGINKNCLTMDNGDTFDISRPKLKIVCQMIADYLR